MLQREKEEEPEETAEPSRGSGRRIEDDRRRVSYTVDYSDDAPM